VAAITVVDGTGFLVFLENILEVWNTLKMLQQAYEDKTHFYFIIQNTS
jgi:glycogen synthase